MESDTALTLERYRDQQARWPAEGRHILAQYDETSVVVYQAYRPAIGHYAARHGRFGDEFSLNRMSWIKPNFLWMMYRSGWGTKDGQEVTLAIWLRRAAFEEILREAVPSSYTPDGLPVTTIGRRRWPVHRFVCNGTRTTIRLDIHSRVGRSSLGCAETRWRAMLASGCCASRTSRRWSRANMRLCARAISTHS
jgi:hypothetical protein